jgi:hypothetical protein
LEKFLPVGEIIPLDDPEWGEIRKRMEKHIPRVDSFELLVVWETQQNKCKKLISASQREGSL